MLLIALVLFNLVISQSDNDSDQFIFSNQTILSSGYKRNKKNLSIINWQIAIKHIKL